MSERIRPASRIDHVRYEIRGALAQRAAELEHAGHEILHLNIGNPAAFGLATPEHLHQAVIDNLDRAQGYGPQMGIAPAREAVALSFQNRGLAVDRDQVIIGNGVSELVDLSLRALLEPGDEVLIPAPDYPLWSACVTLNGGTPVYYPCPAGLNFMPDLEALEQSITKRTKALVIINPNNPTGAVYDKEVLVGMAELAQRHQLLILSDEIYDGICYDDAKMWPMATLTDGLCITFGGLSKVFRACGYRVGWAVLSGDRTQASEYWAAIEKLAALRLSASMPGQWAVEAALNGQPSIEGLIGPEGRLNLARRAIVDAVASSPYLSLVEPKGALYAFPSIDPIAQGEPTAANLDDHGFARMLLEEAHIFVVPGSGFNIHERHFFRVTFLPEAQTLTRAFAAIDALLDHALNSTHAKAI